MSLRRSGQRRHRRAWLVGALVTAVGAVGALVSWNIREHCRDLREGNDNADLPDDPTAHFLGDSAFKVPTTIAAVGGAAWYLLDKLGVLKIVWPN